MDNSSEINRVLDFCHRHNICLSSSSSLDTESKLAQHILDCLGSLDIIVRQNRKDLQFDDRNDLLEAKRHTLAGAIGHFSDRLSSDKTKEKESYPRKWLREHYPMPEGSVDWLPAHWSAALCNSSEAGRSEDLKCLLPHLRKGHEVSPLSLAVAQASPDMNAIKSILSHNPKAIETPDADGAYPFMYASAWNTSISTVQYLHSIYPASATHVDKYGFRALHYACYVNTIDIIKYLVSINAKAVRQPNNYGVLPLQAVIVNHHHTLDLIQYIHSIYPDAIRIPDDDGVLPLHRAVQHGSLDIVMFAHVQYPEAAAIADKEGLLPMHYFSLRENKEDLDVQEFIISVSPVTGGKPPIIPTSSREEKECVIM